MTATFWTGSSLSFTNGSKTVTVNTGPSLGNVKPNSRLEAGSYNQSVEIESVSGNTITLFNNWPGSSGTTSATITPSAATVAAAGVAAQQVITEIQNLVGSASATATANSFVKRDSNGRVKTATPTANDDAVNKGYLGTAATKDAQSGSYDETNGRMLLNGAHGLGAKSSLALSNANELKPNGFYQGGGASASNFPSSPTGGDASYFPFISMCRPSSEFTSSTFHVGKNFSSGMGAFIRATTDNGATWAEAELYHSGNTKLDEFGGLSGDVIMRGANANSTLAVFYREIPFNSTPTGTSVTGTFKIRSPLSNTTLASGVVPVFNAANSSKSVLVLTVSTSGLPSGKEPLELVAETTASININQ